MYDIFHIEINVINNYPFIDFSPNIPTLLSDKIRDLIKDYFKN